MKVFNKGVFVLLSLLTVNTQAVELQNAKIKDVSVNLVANDVYIQTTPAIDLVALGCSSQAGLLIPKDNAEGLKATLSMLLSAQAMQYPVNLTAEYANGKCQLTKLTIKAI